MVYAEKQGTEQEILTCSENYGIAGDRQRSEGFAAGGSRGVMAEGDPALLSAMWPRTRQLGESSMRWRSISRRAR